MAQGDTGNDSNSGKATKRSRHHPKAADEEFARTCPTSPVGLTSQRRALEWDPAQIGRFASMERLKKCLVLAGQDGAGSSMDHLQGGQQPDSSMDGGEYPCAAASIETHWQDYMACSPMELIDDDFDDPLGLGFGLE